MRTRPLHLSLLLHMHQPWYVTPESTPAGWEGDPSGLYALLPWVRLHGAAGYLDVATALLRHPGARLTVNLVPSLLVQLQAVAAGARDRYLDLCDRPVEELDLDERAFLLSKLFSINWSRGVEPRPRYRELLDKRGRHATPGEIRRRAALFSPEELRDLTVLFHLAWLGRAAREGDEAVAALERKGGGFTRDDLHVVIERGRAACGKVIPLYRALLSRGQIEISCSPAYHPIVPLLCDSDVAREPRPDAALPPRFAWPEDAALQIRRGREVFQRCFGQPAGGMWPPEGSISRAALAAYAEAGTTWLVSDEGNLWRALGGCPQSGAETGASASATPTTRPGPR
jgi:alpha-amylase/alpha-mannosidase (GH57 family)